MKSVRSREISDAAEATQYFVGAIFNISNCAPVAGSDCGIYDIGYEKLKRNLLENLVKNITRSMSEADFLTFAFTDEKHLPPETSYWKVFWTRFAGCADWLKAAVADTTMNQTAITWSTNIVARFCELTKHINHSVNEASSIGNLTNSTSPVEDSDPSFLRTSQMACVWAVVGFSAAGVLSVLQHCYEKGYFKAFKKYHHQGSEDYLAGEQAAEDEGCGSFELYVDAVNTGKQS